FAHSHAFLQQRIKMPAVAAKAGQSELRLQGDELGAFCWRLVPSSDKSPMAKADAESLIARDIAAEASRLLGGAMQLDGRRPHPRDIAVLTRTNKQAVLVQEALRAAGIASAIGKAGDIFETEELIELERV